MPAVSVVIPLFNKRSYIIRCLESVARQSARDFEVIVVDDGSTDESADVAIAFHDDRVRVIRQNNCGVGAARNRGIKESRGQLVAFLDADDEWKPSFLESVLDLWRQYPKAGILACGFRRQRGEEADTETTLAPPLHGYQRIVMNYLQLAKHGNFITSSSAAIPRAILAEFEGFPENEPFGEDRDLWVRIALRYPVAFDVRILAIYHSEAQGRACDQRPVSIHYPPAVKTLRRALEQNQVPADKLHDVQSYIDLLQMQYAYWQLGLRNRAHANRLLREPYFTLSFRARAVACRCLLRFLPMRAVEALRLKPLKAIARLRQLISPATESEIGDVLRYGELVIRTYTNTVFK